MESDQNQQYQSEDGKIEDSEISEQDDISKPVEVVPGAPVVRSNTPRPFSFNTLLAASGHVSEEQTEDPAPVFPGKAPAAPPLPEELEDSEKEVAADDMELTSLHEDVPQEFVWLFEYGLEMDSNVLNSVERLDGAAFLYGPAVLKGYKLMLAEIADSETQSNSRRFLTTIVPYSDKDAEVWGVLYRIPRHVTTHSSEQPSLLDTVHSSGTPHSLFRPIAVVVREIYREREISCGTYMLTDTVRRRMHLLTVEQAGYNTPLIQRLVSLARKQKFPDKYLNARTVTTTASATSGKATGYVATPLPQEKNTEPIPVLRGKSIAYSPAGQKYAVTSSPRLLSVLAIYLVFVLLLALVFALLQGLGFAGRVLTPGVLILGVPWGMLFYGLLGSSVSSLVALARSRQVRLPLFALVLWFARPYLGIVLAALAYLLFNSGLFTVSTVDMRQSTLLPLLGALAGLSEGWLFPRRHQ